MQLSPEREAELIEINMPKIYRSVDNFVSKYTGSNRACASYDDCVQEVSLAFLRYIRKCETEEQMNVFPWYDAMQAMSQLVLLGQPFSVPARTSDFSRVIHSLPATVSYEVLASRGIEVDGMSKHWVPDKNTEMDFCTFMDSQGENVQRIAAMRIYGMTQRDIAAQFGVCKRAIDKKITKLREDYDEFMKEDEDNE